MAPTPKYAKVTGAAETRFKNQATEARDALVSAVNSEASNDLRLGSKTPMGHASNVPDTFYGMDGAPGKYARVTLGKATNGKTIKADFGISRGHGYWEAGVAIYEFYGNPIVNVTKEYDSEEGALGWVLKSLREYRESGKLPKGD
jgi:hypothetical protein